MTNKQAHRHFEIIAQLTLAEKTAITSGANFWNTAAIPRLEIPSIMLTDGPHGVRKQGGAADHLGINASLPATSFPTAATLANSWDPALLEQVGVALGEEASAYDVAVLLGPGLNLKRDPLGGRNFEYFSEDPYLSGTLAGAMIRGIQTTGVAACPKHFAVNSQETHRMTIDELVDNRALHELYLEGFRIAIQQGHPRTIMTSYNKVNGTFAHENSLLLHEILREKWGFAGMVVSDWGGAHHRVASVTAGGSLEMPAAGGFTNAEVIDAVQNGELAEADLDARVAEVLDLVLASPAPAGADPAPVYRGHRALAWEAAAKSIVLVKNDGGALPLGPASGRVAVIGDFAETPRYQGSGSSRVNPHALTTLLDGLAETDLKISGYAPGFHRTDRASASKLRRAVDLANSSDIVLAFLGLNESAEAEGFDRAHMRLPRNQLRALRALVDTGRPVVVVLAGGAPIELPFAGEVAAIVHGYLPGQEGGAALADVLTGAVNPAGRLAETYPLHHADAPAAPLFARGETRAEHRESIYVGYRYYDSADLAVRYPFGHGLSYTTFAYANAALDGGELTLTVTNTGTRDGDEVVQVYSAPHGERGFRPARELAGFTRVHVPVGASVTARISLREHAFSVYDVAAADWRIRSGAYRLLVGASSRDFRLTLDVEVREDGARALSLTEARFSTEAFSAGAGVLLTELGEAAGSRSELAGPRSELSGPGPETSGIEHVEPSTRALLTATNVHRLNERQFADLLGRPLPPARWDLDAPLTGSDPISQGARRGGLAGLLYHGGHVVARLLRLIGKPSEANNVILVLDFPFHALSRMSSGLVTPDMLDAILDIANGHVRRGTSALIRRALQNSRKGRLS